MCPSLFKQEFKAQIKTWLLFAVVIAMYGGIIVAMYDPEIGKGMLEMTASMPQLFSAFGMSNPGSTLTEFLSTYLYGFILILVPLIFTIILAYKLIAKYVDTGSMAYLLNTKHSRSAILRTQLAVAITHLSLLILFTTILTIGLSATMFPDELEITKLLSLNIGLWLLHALFLSLCFLCAVSFNEIKLSVGLGAGVSIGALLIQMLSQVNQNTDFMKFFTPMTLYQPGSLVHGESMATVGLIVLLFLTIMMIGMSLSIFKKRDLPL